MEGRRFLYLIFLLILHLSSICDCQVSWDYFPTTGNYFRTRGNYFQTSGNYPQTRGNYFQTSRDYLRTRGNYFQTTGDYLLSRGDYLQSTIDYKQENCQVEKQYSGEIYYSTFRYDDRKCWKIEVPSNYYIRLNVTELSTRLHCDYGYLSIIVAGTGEKIKFCGDDTNRMPVTALNDVHISFNNEGYRIILRIRYNIENLVCAQKEHFRCSNISCIYKHQVCDGVKDCENGADESECETGVPAIKGVNISRENAIRWLRSQWTNSFGWGRNTHRAITALYLGGAAVFGGGNVEGELMAKQLELQTSVALLRNSTDHISISDLSMFINALTVTCHNPRQFYGYDLLQILSDRVTTNKTSSSPAAYLTLCNGNWTFTESHVLDLIPMLYEHSQYPFNIDFLAMTLTALTCVRNKMKNFENIEVAALLYNSTIQQLIEAELQDGSFGNVYTTALVTQALIASGQQSNKQWKLNSTAKYLMKELNTSTDFLSAYYTLPVFNGKSLVDIGNVNCTNRRKHGKDDDISDVTNKLGGKVRINYSLYVGDQRDVIHSMSMRTPENSSAYEVMKLAQVVDHKYKFQHRKESGHMYVYTIAGIPNDPEAGKFWLLYIRGSGINETVHHYTEGPDKLILSDGDHLIMWYRSPEV